MLKTLTLGGSAMEEHNPNSDKEERSTLPYVRSQLLGCGRFGHGAACAEKASRY